MYLLNVTYDPATEEATLFLDNSAIEKLDTCKRAGGIYLCKQREGAKDKPALAFGKIIHKLLEYRYRNNEKSVQELSPFLVDIAAAEFEKYTPPEGDYRNFAMAVDVINEYQNKYNFDPFTNFEFNGQPAIEVPFACPLCTIQVDDFFNVIGYEKKVFIRIFHVVIKGKIDRIFTHDSRLYIKDHKTTSMMGPSYFADFQISSQVYTYGWAAKQLTGRLPYGFMVNALGIRPPTKTGKKLEFVRNTVLLYETLMDEWVTDTQVKIEEFIECARRQYFPKQTKWCAGKYGLCEYHQVCTLPPDVHNSRDMMLSTGAFKDVTWDPLKSED